MMSERKRRAHEAKRYERDDGVLELRRPVARATTVDGKVWEVYAEVEGVMDGDATLWAVCTGAKPKKLEFADFVLTPEGKEALLVWAARCAATQAGERRR